MQDPQTLLFNDDHIAGPTSAPVIIIMYGDFCSPDSKAGYHLILEEFDESDDTISFIFRYLLDATDSYAVNAIAAAEAAAKQGKYWEMVHMLFEQQQKQTKKDLYNIAHDIHLDIMQFEKDFDVQESQKRIKRHIKSALQYGITVSPGYMINDTILDETPDKATLMDIIGSHIQLSDLVDHPVIDIATNHAIDYGSDDPEAYELNPMPLDEEHGYIKDISDPTDTALYKPMDPYHGMTLTEDEYATSNQDHGDPEPS